MKIGIFDSGLGGLFIAKHIIVKLPQYDYVYLGDTKNVPYGTRSQEQIYRLTARAVDYLFRQQDCALIILACNTSSSQALRRIQREFLPKHFPDRRVLGVIIPSVEAALQNRAGRVGVMATPATVASKTYVKEFKLANPKVKVVQQAASKLVPLIEANGLKKIDPLLQAYLKPLLAKQISSLVLGCTHYGILKHKVERMAGKKVRVISQDEIIPDKLKTYLKRHPELEQQLSRRRHREFLLTRLSQNFKSMAAQWFSKNIKLKLVKY